MQFYSKKILSLLSLILALTLVQNLHAMRCGTKLVHTGKDADTIGKVRAKCGEPTESYTDTLPIYNHKGKLVSERKLEIWEYDRSPRGFVYIITFEGGRVVDISSGRK